MREVDYARFVEVWTRTSSISEVARELGVTYSYAADTAIRLRKAGVELKKFERVSAPSRAPSRWSRRQPKSVIHDDVLESDLPDPVLHLRPALAIERSDIPSSEMTPPLRWRYEGSFASVDPCWDPLDESSGEPWSARFAVVATAADLGALLELGFELAADGSLKWSTRGR